MDFLVILVDQGEIGGGRTHRQMGRGLITGSTSKEEKKHTSRLIACMGDCPSVITARVPPLHYRSLLALALPATASALLNNAFRLIDQQAAGSIGTTAQAAIGSCTFVLIATYAIQGLAGWGASPLIGRATGAQDPEGRREVIGTAIGLALLLSLGVGSMILIGAPWIVALLGLKGATATEAVTFLRALHLFSPIYALFPLIDGAFVAMGRTRTMMGLQIAAALINWALNPIFIHHLGLGIAGAALATGVARSSCVFLGLYLLQRETGVGWKHLRGPGILAQRPRIFKVGWPITVNTLLYALVYWAVLRVSVSPLGPQVNAALGIGFSALEGVSYPSYLGLSLAIASLVSRNLGAKEPAQAWRAARMALPLSLGIGLIAACIFGFLAEPICSPFSHDPEVLAIAVGYAHALAFSQIAVALETWAEGVLEGAGDTRTIFRWGGPINLLRIPLSYIFAISLGWGPLGIWWAINLTSFIKAIGKARAVYQGKWASLEV